MEIGEHDHSQYRKEGNECGERAPSRWRAERIEQAPASADGKQDERIVEQRDLVPDRQLKNRSAHAEHDGGEQECGEEVAASPTRRAQAQYREHHQRPTRCQHRADSSEHHFRRRDLDTGRAAPSAGEDVQEARRTKNDPRKERGDHRA